jgi:hypothetical protein
LLLLLLFPVKFINTCLCARAFMCPNQVHRNRVLCVWLFFLVPC